jgi:hypothetical protein
MTHGCIVEFGHKRGSANVICYLRVIDVPCCVVGYVAGCCLYKAVLDARLSTDQANTFPRHGKFVDYASIHSVCSDVPRFFEDGYVLSNSNG